MLDESKRSDTLSSHASRRESFLTASVLLTGFSRFELIGTGLADTYLDLMTGAVGTGVLIELGERVAALPSDVSDRDAAIDATLMGDPKFGPVAKNLIKLWYLGFWAGMPEDWSAHYGAPAAVAPGVVSAEAYKEGLAWVAIKAHPVGAKQQGFGAWSLPPAPED